MRDILHDQAREIDKLKAQVKQLKEERAEFVREHQEDLAQIEDLRAQLKASAKAEEELEFQLDKVEAGLRACRAQAVDDNKRYSKALSLLIMVRGAFGLPETWDKVVEYLKGEGL